VKSALVLGAGGFIGNHMVTQLKQEEYLVTGVDLKLPDFSHSFADNFVLGDLRNPIFVKEIVNHASFDEIYQFAADMGGAGYIFTGENDADVMHNSSTINLNLLSALSNTKHPERLKIFYSSSACIYPEALQLNSQTVDLKESSAYPANPDSEYGWEKLFSERLYFAFARNYGLSVRVARFHNVYGPLGTWAGGKEKAPAAICRKIASVEEGGEIEIWGDGNQTRSFLYISDCISAVRRFMSQENFKGPLNIGSEEMVTINELVNIACKIANKSINVKHIQGPTGVQGRNSNNELIKKTLDWDYSISLEEGLETTYHWIKSQLESQ
jgi:nucleoside-diphosphate-sugar epimerase